MLAERVDVALMVMGEEPTPTIPNLNLNATPFGAALLPWIPMTTLDLPGVDGQETPLKLQFSSTLKATSVLPPSNTQPWAAGQIASSPNPVGLAEEWVEVSTPAALAVRTAEL